MPPKALKVDGETVRIGGREYLAVSCNPASYQGYAGPGWLCLGLAPVDAAFSDDDTDQQADINEAVLDAVMSQRRLFPDRLRAIPGLAADIQRNLNRSVWNGTVRQSRTQAGNSSFAKSLLWEIASAGRKTQAVFDDSIGNLQ